MDKPNEVQATLKRKKLEKRTYVGWGSKELTEFLSCIGKDASTPLDHFKVAEVVREYVRQNNLLDGKKKKSVMCDENLHSLFNKRKFKYNMIHSLVETHLSANAISEDESDGSVDDNGYTVKKKPRNSLEPKIPKSVSGIDPIIPKSVSGINKKCLAALNPNNLNLIYLRRTLVAKLLTEPDTFEQKVIGCLVRVKNDLKSYTYMMTKKYYQIGLVTGIKKSSEEYKIKNTCTDVLLCVSGMWDDVKISMLSEEDFEEDECNDLLKSAKKELFKRPTVAELEEKEASVHADIVNHWFHKELRKLEMELERAREKGWRQDIHDISCQKMLLSTPEERQRRLEAIPEVIPDAEEESKETGIESAANIPFQGNREERQRRLEVIPEVIPDAEEGSKETEIESAARSPFQGNRGVIQTVADPSEVGIDESLEGASLRHDAACEVAFEAAGKALCNGGSPGPGLHTPLNTVTGVIDIDNEEDGNGPSHHSGCDKQDIIDLVSDDDEDVQMEQREPEQAKCDGPEAVNGIAAHAHDGPEAVNGVTVPTVRASNDLDGNTGPACSTSQAMARDPVTVNGTGKSDQGWLYKDLQGREHGPYPMAQMREWQQSGYFPEGFRVWRAGKSRRGRGYMLLIDAMRLH
uniref:GYF domain-containing protein n=1 Tax=Aegilops tauschii subsp. strangulata TaxID=200361 RepID=A0A453G756_AEGTS